MSREEVNPPRDAAGNEVIPELREKTLGDFELVKFAVASRGERGHDRGTHTRGSRERDPSLLIEVIVCYGGQKLRKIRTGHHRFVNFGSLREPH